MERASSSVSTQNVLSNVLDNRQERTIRPAQSVTGYQISKPSCCQLSLKLTNPWLGRGSSARWDLCGGPSERVVPTATVATNNSEQG